MERMMSVEDKIRRAEEIYYKRRNNEISAYNSTENEKSKNRNATTSAVHTSSPL